MCWKLQIFQIMENIDCLFCTGVLVTIVMLEIQLFLWVRIFFTCSLPVCRSAISWF